MSMTATEFSAYLEQVRAAHAQPIFIPRQMITREDWDRTGGEEYVRLHGFFREGSPDLAAVLDHPRVVFVGEPGMGKTVLAHASMLHFAQFASLPIFVPLSAYAGDLSELLHLAAPVAAAATTIDGQSVRRAYVLDGLDEVPEQRLLQLLSELDGLLLREPEASYVLTCRQALYEGVRDNVPPSFQEFFPLGFETEDILGYAGKRGLNPDRFSAELDRADLWLEASIPFVLTMLVEVFLQEHALEATRSDNIALVVDGLLEKRTRVGLPRQRKALYLLGLAMELYSRNELTIDEAVRLLSDRLAIEADEARETIDELTRTILLRTASGIRFQVRSFGEYFAARQLEHAGLPQVLSHARFRRTLVLNPTWANTISYLIEMHPRVRAYFVRNEPEWVLASSTAALTMAQRREAACLIVENLAIKGRHLLRDASVNHHHLARLLTAADAPWLKTQAEAQESVRRGNALLLLGHLKDADVLRRAVVIALDRDAETSLRRSAFVVISLSGSSELIPQLLDSVDDQDPLVTMCLDVAGSLLTPETLPQVLPALIQTTTILSETSAHIAEINTREMLVAVLDYLLANPNAACHHSVASYIRPVWKLLKIHSDEEILGKIGLLLANCERHRIWDQELEIKSDLLKALNGRDPVGVVSRTALETILKENLPFRFSAFTVARLCTPQTARWLLERNPPEEMVLQIASVATDDVRNILGPSTGGLVDAQDETRQRFQLQDAERRAREAAAGQRTQDTIRAEHDINLVLRAFAASTPAQWPELDEVRRAWLGTHVSRILYETDALHTVEWLSELQVRYPGTLRVAQVAGHYGLPLEDDVLLTHALLALAPGFLTEYHRKRRLSGRAIAEIERMLGDPTLPTGAVSHVVSFVRTAKVETPAIYENLRRVAVSADQNDMNRNWAASTLAQTSCPIEVLTAARRDATDSRIQTIFLDALTDRQHLPTIFERLNRLPANDEDFAAFERPFPETTELQWIGKIRAPRAWNMLAELRRRILRLGLPNLAGIVESTLATIDKARLIGVLVNQLPETPEAWREFTKDRIADYERELRFERAASINFEEVLARLADASANYRVRLLCEGLTDVPVFRFLLDCKGLNAVSTLSVGGWGNVCSPLFDVGPYIDGFQYAVLVLDGDSGRVLSAPDRPVKLEIQEIINKVHGAGVPTRVLMRYSIENYFSQGAFEKVLGRDLSGSFPLDEIRPVPDQIGGYHKNRNADVIRYMQATDFDGTDIAEILDELRKNVEESA
jgi:hypothetical protein